VEAVDKAREAKRIYMRAWRRKNKDKVKAAQERYWQKKAVECKEQSENK